MKRFVRILRRVATVISLVHCGVVTFAWTKSYDRVNRVEPAHTFQSISPNTWFEIGSDEGNLYLLRIAGIDMNHGSQLDPTGKDGNHGDAVLIMPNEGGSTYKLRLLYWSGKMHGYDTGDSMRWMCYLENLAPSYPPSKPAIARWNQGNAFAKIDGFHPPNGALPTYQLLTMRYWFIVVLLALSPGYWLAGFAVRTVRRIRSDRLIRRGCCSVCGYDLRATPRRCPECGAIPAK